MPIRRKSAGSESLDLLLDAITNAFGGILLVAILIVLLARSVTTTQDNSKPVDPIELIALSDTLSDLEMKRIDLQSEYDARLTLRGLQSPELKEILHDLKDRREKRISLESDRTKAIKEIAEIDGEVNELEERLAQLNEEQIKEKNENASVSRELLEEKKRREINNPFPEQRSTPKLEYSFMLRYGRLYEKRKRNEYGRGEPNLDDFFLVGKDAQYLTITPKPYKGIQIIEGGKLSGMVKRKFSGIKPHQFYISIAVWDDSYDSFQILRDHLTEKGFDYRLLPVTDGDVVFEGYIADPKVQ